MDEFLSVFSKGVALCQEKDQLHFESLSLLPEVMLNCCQKLIHYEHKWEEIPQFFASSSYFVCSLLVEACSLDLLNPSLL